jgi:hypothetical protein
MQLVGSGESVRICVVEIAREVDANPHHPGLASLDQAPGNLVATQSQFLADLHFGLAVEIVPTGYGRKVDQLGWAQPRLSRL